MVLMHNLVRFDVLGYMNEQGLKIIKSEKDLNSQLQYTFIRSYPRSITSMPVTYDYTHQSSPIKP